MYGNGTFCRSMGQARLIPPPPEVWVVRPCVGKALSKIRATLPLALNHLCQRCMAESEGVPKLEPPIGDLPHLFPAVGYDFETASMWTASALTAFLIRELIQGAGGIVCGLWLIVCELWIVEVLDWLWLIVV